MPVRRRRPRPEEPPVRARRRDGAARAATASPRDRPRPAQPGRREPAARRPAAVGVAAARAARSRRPAAEAAAGPVRAGAARATRRAPGDAALRERRRAALLRGPAADGRAADRAQRARRGAYHCPGNEHRPRRHRPPRSTDVADGLRAVGYLPGESTALVSFLATKLGKPVLVEGPAGVGKTELAKALASYLGRELVRLQCYEGLDEAKALYEWNYRKQLLRIQAEAAGTGWEAVQEDIFGEEFLLARPLMTAIASEQPVVLLIDEIDKTDQEFEAMLLEVLSDFQISIPELGRVESRTHPVVLLTSNNSRELTEALKRRCLYLWLDYPELEHELEIVQAARARAVRDGRAPARRGGRHGARPRPQEAAVDRRVDRLGARAAAARRAATSTPRRSPRRCR